MFKDLFKLVYKNAQTFGKEDILTALLATMFEVSQGLSVYFLNHPDISCPSHIVEELSATAYIKAGVTYYNEFDEPQYNYRFRPDMLISSLPDFSGVDSHKVLIESKLFSSLTTNQTKGYPEIKRRRGDSIFLLLVSYYESEEFHKYFDRVVYWKQVFEIVKFYIDEHANITERFVLAELLDACEVGGIDFVSDREGMHVDVRINEVVKGYVDIPTFVKESRRNLGMTQSHFAKEIGVGLRFIRELEQGNKDTMRSDKVNLVLDRFNCTLAPVFKTEYYAEEE